MPTDEQVRTRRRMEASRSFGDGRRLRLRLGSTAIVLEGLDPADAEALARRWSGFVDADPDGIAVRLRDAGPGGWLPEPRPGETYRIERRTHDDTPWILSYRFALCADADRVGTGAEPAGWTLALSSDGEEPRERRIENAVRALVARTAAVAGGLALHAAGVLERGRAVLFAGPSNAGKSTAVRHSAPRRSLGDDFAWIVPSETRDWVVPALPFDNAERPPGPPGGPYPLARLYLLEQAERDEVVAMPELEAVAAVLGCTAMPWLHSERREELLAAAARLAAAGRVARLRLRNDPSFWTALERDLEPLDGEPSPEDRPPGSR